VTAKFVGSSDHGFDILLWPNSGIWPKDGEIDLAELPTGVTDVQSSAIYGTSTPHSIYVRTSINPEAWHTYSVDWQPGKVTIYIDGKVTQTVTGSAVPSTAMHLAIQAGPNTAKASNTSGDLYVSSVKVFYPAS
jgi:beta-glucanase (GH16 family)